MNEIKSRLSIIFLIVGLVVGVLILNVSAEDAKSGEVIGEYQGVVARSNGAYTGTGIGEWQCVEYVDRFYEEAMGIPGAKNWKGNGKQYYGKASVFGLTAYEDGKSVSPYPCDLLCFGGGDWGHVAIVTGIDDNYIYIIEQNWNRNYAYEKLEWNKDTNEIYHKRSTTIYIQGWLRKDAWNFNTPNNAEGWEAINAKESSVNGGRYFINPKQNDPYIQSAKISLNATTYNAIEINMSSNCPDGNATIYFATEDSPEYSESKTVEFKVNTGNDWDTYTIYMANHNLWKGTITGIRINPAENGRSGVAVDTVGFDWIKVIKTDKKPTIVNYDLEYFPIMDSITFEYWIKNPFANDFEGVRLGAQIRTSNLLIEWIDDSANDKVVTLNSGTYESQRKYERYFELPIFASLGEYDAHWVILENKMGIWYDDKEKANAFTIEELSPSKPKLDLIIAFDTTGSMADDIADAKASASLIVAALDLTGFDYRVAIVDYRDRPEYPYGGDIDYVHNLDQPFSNDKDVIIDAINGLTLGNGMDWKEAVYSVLVLSMIDVNKDVANSDNYGWRKGAYKAIILLGDAPPQGGPESYIPEPWIGGYALDDVAYWSEEIDPIRVYSIVVGYDSNTYAAFSEISERTGGKVYLSPNADDVSDAIIKAIEDMEDDGYGVEVNITPTQNKASPKDSVFYSVNITNKGDLADVYDVSFEAENIAGSCRGYPLSIQNSWIMFDDSKMKLDPSMSEIRSLTISVPENWAGMEDAIYTFGVNAKSKTDANVSNTTFAELKIKANKRSMIEYSKLEIQWLSELVNSSTINQGIKNALLAKLNNAESKTDQALVGLDNGNEETADNMLQVSQNLINAFVNQVEAQYDKKIMQPDADAEMLKEKAGQIMEDLEEAKNAM